MKTQVTKLKSMAVLAAMAGGIIAPIATAAPASATSALVSIGDASAVEGNVGMGRAITFPITLDGPTNLDVAIDWNIQLGSATAADIKYSATGFKTATIRAGKVQAFANVTIYADTIADEGDETFEIHILGVTINASVNDHMAVGTVIDDDSVSSANPILGAGGGSVHEGNLGTRQGKIWVTLSAPSLSTVAVVATLTDTGAGTFYKAYTKTLIFLPGQFKKPVVATIYPNGANGGDRIVTLVLSGATFGVNIITPSVDNTIVDDDDPSAGHIISITDPRLTAEQVLRAQALIDASTAGLAPYVGLVGRTALNAALLRRGYVSAADSFTGFEHYLNSAFMNDGIELNATKVESVVLQRQPDGSWVLGAAMYLLNTGKTMSDVPEIAGTFTTWHDHPGLCWNGLVIAGSVFGGDCTQESFRPFAPMLHVWVTPQVCGPFVGTEGFGGTCVH